LGGVSATFSQDPPSFQTSTHLVQITASVSTEAGEGVDDLGPLDFQVSDNGTVQRIALFQPPVGAQDKSPTRPATTDHALGIPGTNLSTVQHRLLIVLEPMQVDNRHRAVRAIRSFLARSEAAAYSISLIDGPRLVQQYSSDTAKILQALSRIEEREYVPGRTGALNNWLGPTLSAVRELAGMPGRKSMVLFIDFDVPTVHALWPELAIQSNVVLYPVDARGLVPVVPFGDASAEHQFGPGASVLGTSWAGPLVAAGIMARTSALAEQAMLLRAAEEATGGRRLANDNDLSKVFRFVEEDQKGVYVLGYYLDESMMDGRFHRVEVRVSRPGLKVRTKEGYYAPRRYGAVR
jgi:VWFA-related protein